MEDMKAALVSAAEGARKKSYSPYSGFAVGAAVLTDDDRIFTGTNVENSSYPVSCCAERVAIFKAVSEGVRAFKAIAVCGGPADGEALVYCPPCGMCRQAIAEFFPTDAPVYLPTGEGETVKELTAGDLLPEAFGKDTLL